MRHLRGNWAPMLPATLQLSKSILKMGAQTHQGTILALSELGV